MDKDPLDAVIVCPPRSRDGGCAFTFLFFFLLPSFSYPSVTSDDVPTYGGVYIPPPPSKGAEKQTGTAKRNAMPYFRTLESCSNTDSTIGGASSPLECALFTRVSSIVLGFICAKYDLGRYTRTRARISGGQCNLISRASVPADGWGGRTAFTLDLGTG